jgi:hypothetical protein
MKIRSIAFLFISLSFLLFASGCYYQAAKSDIATANQKLSELKTQGGEKLVPYEYTLAEKFLENAQREFDEVDYKNSKMFAEKSKAASESGLANIKKQID